MLLHLLADQSDEALHVDDEVGRVMLKGLIESGDEGEGYRASKELSQ